VKPAEPIDAVESADLSRKQRGRPLACGLALLDERFRFSELGEAPAAERLAELEQAAGLDLPDALAGNAVDLGNLVERPRMAILQPVASTAKLLHRVADGLVLHGTDLAPLEKGPKI
jgi:hypothetical protein